MSNQTVKQLFGILNDQEVIRALEDFERPRGRLPRRQPAAALPVMATRPG